MRKLPRERWRTPTNQSKVQKRPQSIREKRDGQSSDDDELADLSEKANRIEGAGGNDFHYFCRICKFAVFRQIKMLGINNPHLTPLSLSYLLPTLSGQISFYRHNAFKHHMNNSKEQHKKMKAQQKAKKELDTEIQCKE